MAGVGGRSWAAAIVLVGLVVTGCSGTSASGSAPDASTTTEAPGPIAPRGTSTTGTGPAGGATTTTTGGTIEELTAGALLLASDFGTGWTRQSVTDAPLTSTSRSLLSVAECQDLVPDAGEGTDSEASAQADYTTTITGSALDVQYQVDLYPTVDDAAAIVELVENPGFATCIGTALTSMVDDVTIGDVQISPMGIPNAAELGLDDAAAVQATISITSAGQAATVLAQVVVLQHGGALGTFTVTSTSTSGTPRPLDLHTGTVEAAAANLQAIGS